MAVTYCTADDVRLIVDPDSDEQGVTTGVLSDAGVESHIERAESLINSYIGSKYTVPFTAGSIPPIIKTICVDLASYYVLAVLYSRDGQNINDNIKDYYTRHIDDQNEKEEKNGTLDKIVDGKIVVLLSDGSEAPRGSEAVESTTEDYHSTFDADDPTRWDDDTNKLDDIADARDD